MAAASMLKEIAESVRRVQFLYCLQFQCCCVAGRTKRNTNLSIDVVTRWLPLFCDVPLSRAVSLSVFLTVCIWAASTLNLMSGDGLETFSLYRDHLALFILVFLLMVLIHRYTCAYQILLQHSVTTGALYFSLLLILFCTCLLVSCFQVLFVVLFLPRWLLFNAIPLLQTTTRRYFSSQQKYGFNVLKCWKKEGNRLKSLLF